MGLESHVDRILKGKVPEGSYGFWCGKLYIMLAKDVELIQKVLNDSGEFGFAHTGIWFDPIDN